MAIQVGGTTVIDNSRNLQNVGGLKTVNGNSLVGSGDISAGGGTTTTTSSVGSLSIGRPQNYIDYARGATVSNFKTVKAELMQDPAWYAQGNYFYYGETVYSEAGTWRFLTGSFGRDDGDGTGWGNCSLAVRIS